MNQESAQVAAATSTASSRLAQLGIRFPYMIGPMVGLTHVAMRELIRRYLPAGLDALLFTEMLSSLRLPSERLTHADELRVAPGETHVVPQLLANEEWYIKRSLQKLEGISPWGIDINMGCPVKQTLRHNWGVRLMGDPKYAAQVVRLAKQYSLRPISVKMRCGLDEADLDYILRFTDHIEQAGADWITIHARPKAQKHKGQANWQIVADVRERRSIPVVVNGDIQTAEDALGLMADASVDGVMIGRAATARPWILWQIAERLGYQDKPFAFSERNAPQSAEEEGAFYLDSLIHFIDLLEHYFDNEAKKMKRFKFYLIQGHKWFFYGHSLYSRCMKCRSLPEIRDMLCEYQQTVEFPMTQRITLQ
ncbi:MAG: tRNA dihydrouridine synthase [Oligoflexus sp.]